MHIRRARPLYACTGTSVSDVDLDLGAAVLGLVDGVVQQLRDSAEGPKSKLSCGESIEWTLPWHLDGAEVTLRKACRAAHSEIKTEVGRAAASIVVSSRRECHYFPLHAVHTASSRKCGPPQM